MIIKNFIDSIKTNKNKELGACISTLICQMVFCVIIPMLANVFKVTFITKYINTTAVYAYAVIFGIGAFISLILCLLMKSKKETIKEKGIQVSDNRVNNKLNLKEISYVGNDNVADPQEIIISNLPSNTLDKKGNASTPPEVGFGDKEYNPTGISISKNTNHTNKTTASEINKEKLNKNNKTNVLFDTSNDYSAFIIKKGNISVVDRIYIDNENFIIGRIKGSSSFAIEEKSVSKQHATIKVVNDKYFIVDNNSSNGTFLNGTRLKANNDYRLNDGDLVSFAKQDFQFFCK